MSFGEPSFLALMLAASLLAGLAVGAVAIWIVFRAELRRLHALKTQLRWAKSQRRAMEFVALHASDGLLLQDIHGKIEWSNPAYTRMTGFSAEEILGRNPLEFILPPEDKPSDEEIAKYRYDINQLDSFEIVRNVRKNGELFWSQLGFAVIEDEQGADPRVIVIARDITEQIEREEALKRAQEDLQKRAETDGLTGLANRLRFDAFLAEALKNAGEESGEVGLIHIDLDQFKEVNDTLGHAAGDAVLARTGRVLTQQIGEHDLACRFGGDEFVIVCPGTRNPEGLEVMARRILARLRLPMTFEGVRITTGASIGIAVSGPQSREPQVLMRQADVALYEIKNSGRNSVLFYSEMLGELVDKRTEISSALSHGMANNELGVVLQPQFDLATHKVIGFEALMRWYHPRRGMLSPGDFFSVAERNGQMEGIDLIAVRGALNALRTLRDAGYPDMRMSINVSGRGLNQDDYLDQLKWEVEQRGLRPEDVAVEVLETTLFEGRDNQAARSIAALSAAGFAVELDDFGSGYSGLVNLARLKIQGVKIDRALVQNLVTDRTSQTIVQAIFRLCRDLGLNVVSEGVERPEQAHAIAAFGGRVIQGYGIARPMPLDKALTWLRETDMEAMFEATADARSKRDIDDTLRLQA